MATFFIPSSSLILLHLLFITTGDFLRRTSAAPLDHICRQTREPRRCISLLHSTDSRTTTASLPILAQIATDTALFYAGRTKIKVHNLMLSKNIPNLQTVYRNCENLYLDALDALEIAPEYVLQRKYGKLKEVAGIIRRAVGGCAVAVRNNVRLERENEDVGVVGEAIAGIARNMH